jgi:4-amino-4-deoxy-L-arabinose transferase-like glycosyltransferase
MSGSLKIEKPQTFSKKLTRISRWHIILLVVSIFIIAAAFRLYNVASHRLIYADESLISYVAFDWMKFGAMPYRDIWAPQSYNPIMYVMYQLSYQIFGFNALAIRMVAVVPGIISTLLLYLIGRDLFGNKVGLVASFIYAIYIPFSVELEHSYGYNHSFVNMLGLAALFFLLKGINHEKKTRSEILLAICGISMFFAITIKPYIALIFLVALGIIAHRYRFKVRQLVRPYLILFITLLVSFSLLVLYLYINGAFEAWLYCFQHGRLFSISLEQKVIRFDGFIIRTLFVMMFAVPVAIWGFIKRESKVLYLFFWFLIPTVSIVSLGNFTDGTLFTTFAPLVLLSAVGITWLLNQAMFMIRVKNWRAVLPVAVIILSITVANAYTNFAYYANYMYSANPEVAAQISVGEAIANITSPTDKIFVTDTALAVLSQREVITVGSIKVAGFYNDLMGYDFERYIGIPGYPEGIINNDMILSALESEKPAVIVISRHDVFGLLDEIIWTGGQEQIYHPLGPYIMRNYVLNKTIEYDGKRWEIWSFSPGHYHTFDLFSNQSSIMLGENRNVSFDFTVQTSNSNYTTYSSPTSFTSTNASLNLAVNYTFSNENHAFVRPTIEFANSTNLASFKSVSIWINGDNSSNTLWMDLVDDAGREYGITARKLDFFGWKNVIVNIDSFAEQGIDVFAIKQMRISIDNNSENVWSGIVVLADWALLS